jgi:hypothetical protein
LETVLAKSILTIAHYLNNLSGKYKQISIGKLTGILLFLLASLWFYFPGEYVLVANQDLSLFIPSPGYLLSFLDRPGGLLEYFGSFLSQFFRFRLAGAVVLAAVIAAGYFAALSLFARVSDKKTPLFAGVLAFVFLMGMHNFYPHKVSHSLGFILVIILAAKIPSDRIAKRVFLAIAIPVIYLVSGGFVWFFCGLVLAMAMTVKGKADVMAILLTLLYPAVIVACATWFVYLYPWKDLIGIQLPFGPGYGQSIWPYLFVAWMFLMLLLPKVPVKMPNLNRRLRLGIELSLCLVGMVLVLHFSYNRKNAEFFAIENMAVNENWDGLLKYTQEHPSTNLFGCFYTNLALVNKGMLCEALFQYPQGFGRRGLCFGWEEKEEILRRGSDFFWTIYFVNEAHHWAYESMIVEGFTQRNIKRLIQTELVRGNFKVAEKYIAYLGSAMFQKKLADHYSKFLDNPKAIVNDPELGPRMLNQIQQDFFAEGADLEKNLRSVLSNNPSNQAAQEYLMALYLLEKEVDRIEPFLYGYQETHDGNLPTLLDESLLVFQITHQDDPPSSLRVSPATLQRFEEYTRMLRQYRNPEEAARMLYPTYKHSFWFHLNFTSLPNQ